MLLYCLHHMNRSSDTAHAPDVLAALRHATAARHERLDSALPLAAADATLADYASHLHLLRDWLLPCRAGWTASATGRRVRPVWPRRRTWR